MKILIYTDVHCSRTSSILPLYNSNSKYTTRLEMIINSFKWMYGVAHANNVDRIINLGDTFDKNVVKSEELTAISECYKMSEGIRELHVVGNHELLDEDRKFHATSVFNNYPFISIIDHPVVYDNEFSILPYMSSEKIDFDLLSKIKNKILLSHIDIKGSSIRSGYDLTGGVDPEFLAMNFDCVLNGHIHKHSIVNSTSGIIMNVGSMTSISFADSNTNIPSIVLMDTETLEYQRLYNPESILFRKFKIRSLNDLIKTIEKLDLKYRYVIGVECPYEIKDDVKDYILSKKDSINCISHKITTYISDINKLPSSNSNKIISNSSDIKFEFLDFIDNNKNLIKYPFENVKSLIEEI